VADFEGRVSSRCVCGRFGSWHYLLNNWSWPVGMTAPMPLTSCGPLRIGIFAACRDHRLDRRARARARWSQS
jgi:hypothetical protein